MEFFNAEKLNLENSLQVVVPLGCEGKIPRGFGMAAFPEVAKSIPQRMRNPHHTQTKAASSSQCPKFLKGLWELKKKNQI